MPSIGAGGHQMPPTSANISAVGIPGYAAGGPTNNTTQSLVTRKAPAMPKPQWHPPWKLYRVISGHIGWVRCVAVDPTNEWFCTGSADRVIKVIVFHLQIYFCCINFRHFLTDLGFSHRSTQTFTHRSRQYSSCPSSQPETPLPVQCRWRSTGEMLGSRIQQSHSTLPRPLERRLQHGASSNNRRFGDLRSRFHRPCLGYANQSKYPHTVGSHQHGSFSRLPSSRTSGD